MANIFYRSRHKGENELLNGCFTALVNLDLSLQIVYSKSRTKSKGIAKIPRGWLRGTANYG
jgi:hypothetical protein